MSNYLTTAILASVTTGGFSIPNKPSNIPHHDATPLHKEKHLAKVLEEAEAKRARKRSRKAAQIVNDLKEKENK